jgi:hypothetical protein
MVVFRDCGHPIDGCKARAIGLMRLDDDLVLLSATDVANHLACRHLTYLDLHVALGRRSAPWWHAPEVAILEQRGLEHERRYLDSLRPRRDGHRTS